MAGYRIASVGRASGKTLVIVLVEKKSPDTTASPTVRYRHTSSGPVTDRAGNQALAQVFRGVRAHRNPGATPPPPPLPPPPPADPTLPPDTDPDRDGYSAPLDCAPDDPAIHPGAPDPPDLAFIDSNCDGIDGDERNAIFASPNGSDNNPGTKAKPKREINTAVVAAAGTGKYVLAAAGVYQHVDAATGVGIYGG